MTPLNAADGSRASPFVYQWQSLAALLRDIDDIQSQNQSLTEQLRHSVNTIQDLRLQIQQLHIDLGQAQDKLREQQQVISDENEQKLVVKKSLEHEFSVLEKTETSLADAQQSLAHERDLNRALVAFVNKFRISGSGDAAFLPDGCLGFVLSENHLLKHDVAEKVTELEENRRALNGSQETIDFLNKEKEAALDTIKQKESEISTLKAETRGTRGDDQHAKGKVPAGKRKRMGGVSV